MNLRIVTMTGADDRTQAHKMVALSKEYPFVEWGLMMDAHRTGLDMRFPTLSQLQDIADLNLNTSVHLCGRLANDAATGTAYPIEAALQFIRGAKRVQINLGKTIKNHPLIFRELQQKAADRDVQIIIQAYSFDIPAVKAARTAASNGRVVFLHDASGGRGVSGDFQSPMNGDLVGFAGGINPDNIEAKLAQIAALGFANPFWIDMESGIRTDDVFDLDKVEHVLRIVQPYVNQGLLDR